MELERGELFSTREIVVGDNPRWSARNFRLTGFELSIANWLPFSTWRGKLQALDAQSLDQLPLLYIISKALKLMIFATVFTVGATAR
jgi:hypothetical protein